MSDYVDDHTSTWVHRNNLGSKSSLQQWVASIYWSYATMTTVGYGDVIAINDSERVFSMFAMVIGVTVFGYTICKVAVTMSTGEPHEEFKEYKLSLVRRFMRGNPIPHSTKERVIEHFAYMFKKSENTLQERNDELLAFLFPRVRNELLFMLHNPVMEQVSIFTFPWVSEELQGDILRAMRYCFFGTGEEIYFCGELGSQMYLLFTGSIELEVDPRRLAKSNKLSSATNGRECQVNDRILKNKSLKPYPYKTVSSNSHFGIVAPVLGCPRVVNAKALSYSEGAFIPQLDVLRLMSDFAEFGVWLSREANSEYKACEKLLHRDSKYALEGSAGVKNSRSKVNEVAGPSAKLNNEVKLNPGISLPNRESNDTAPTSDITENKKDKNQNDLIGVRFDNESTMLDNNLDGNKNQKKGSLEVKVEVRSGILNEDRDKTSEVQDKSNKKLRRLPSSFSKIVGTSRMVDTARGVRIMLQDTGSNRDHEKFIKAQFEANKGKEASYLWTSHRLFHPQHPLKVLWDAIVGILVLYVVVVVPYRILFDIPSTREFEYIDIFVDVMLLIDIVLNFFTSFMRSDGMFETNRSKVAINYLKTWFSIDLLSSIPYANIALLMIYLADLASGSHTNTDSKTTLTLQVFKMLRIIKLFKLIRVLKLKRLCGNFTRKLDLNDEYVEFVKSIFIFVLIAHLYSCIWFFASTQDAWTAETSGQTWVTTYCVFRHDTCLDTFERNTDMSPTYYISSMYWVFATFTTVGYGDVHAIPDSASEVLLSVIAMAVGSIVFARLITSVLSLVAMNANDFAEIRLEVLSDFMRKRNLSMGVQRLVRNAFRLYAKQHNSEFNLGLIYESMPNFLANIIARHREVELLKHKVLAEMDKDYPGFISLLFGLGRTSHLPQGTVIVDLEESVNRIYFILHGLF